MADANTATSADRRRHDVVFNAITRALRDADRFVAITEREAITAAVLNALAADEPQSGAHAQGYAEAVARLRDDERYRSWWSASPESVRPTEPIRGHLADYLETVGPDGPDVTRPAVVEPLICPLDGCTWTTGAPTPYDDEAGNRAHLGQHVAGHPVSDVLVTIERLGAGAQA